MSKPDLGLVSLAFAVAGTLIVAPTLSVGEISASRGAADWVRQESGPDGAPRSCVTCHGEDPRQPGRHAITGKPIAPLAPSVQPGRFSDPEKVEKWFKRNCTWSWGRECTAQEKGDFLTYLRNL